MQSVIGGISGTPQNSFAFEAKILNGMSGAHINDARGKDYW